MAVHFDGGQAEVAQHGRGDVDQRGTAVAGAGGEAVAGDEEERALLVSAETAMLAEAGGVLGLERIAHDGAVAGHAVRVRAVVGLECHCNLHRGTRRQAGRGQARTDEGASDPVLGFEKPRHLSDERPGRIGKIEQGGCAVGCDDDLRRCGATLQPGLDQQPVEIDGLRDRLHSVIRADDEEDVGACRIERRHGLGDTADILVGTPDCAARQWAGEPSGVWWPV